MPEFFTILIKVNIALVLFCAGYYLVLRKLTFYTLNRAYLIAGILFSSAYPFIDLSVFAQRHHEIVAPVQNVIIIWQQPAQKLIQHAAYWNWLEIAFWTGVAVFAARLLFQMVSLYKIHGRSTAGHINGKNVRVVKGDISPFSFWKSIYVNPEKLSAADLQNVLAHEQVHVDEWHTLDVLLAEISVIFYWFNPGIWMMKRAVRENIEFITDRKILQQGMDSKAYQYSLLNITFNQPAPAITSNFNLSTLKKRIMMMNAKRSSKITLTRYTFVVPVVVVCLFTFSLSKAAVVKTNPAFKAVAAAVKNINSFVLKDTVPATRSITGTVTVKKGVNGTTKVITLKGADVNNLTLRIDSPRIERQTVTITGKRPGQKDSVVTFTIADRPMGTFNSTGLSGMQTFKGDSIRLGNIGTLKGNTYITPDGRQIATYNYTTTPDGLIHVNVPQTGDVKTANYKYTTTSDGLTYVNIPQKAVAQTVTGLTFKGDTLRSGNIKYYNNLGFYNGDITNSIEKTKTDSKDVKSTTSDGKVRTVVGRPIPTGSAFRVVLTDANGNLVDPPQPLFIVDGKEINQKDMKSFEGNVQYLDAKAATSAYGSKGKNGALIMTTKKK